MWASALAQVDTNHNRSCHKTESTNYSHKHWCGILTSLQLQWITLISRGDLWWYFRVQTLMIWFGISQLLLRNCMFVSTENVIRLWSVPQRSPGSVLTRSLAFPTTTLLASRLSNTSSDLSWPAAPGRGGKLEGPSSKLGDGGLGGGGGDWGVALCMTATEEVIIVFDSVTLTGRTMTQLWAHFYSYSLWIKVKFNSTQLEEGNKNKYSL